MDWYKWKIGRSIISNIKRRRMYRSDRALRWVFPSIKQYTVITWRRINPRYEMLGGDFSHINKFQVVDVTFCRTRIGAIFVQLLMGREKWTDGFKQQVVEILEPGFAKLMLVPPYADFNDYPTPDNPDLIPGGVLENPYADKVPPKFTDDDYDPTLNLKDSTL